MNVTDDDKEQLGMYHDVKESIVKGRINVLNINETNEGIVITVKLTKKGKSIKEIKNAYDSYGR
jgi:hypothetical protein